MQLSVAIIGAGAGGLCAAIQIQKRLGIDSYTIYEKSSDVGGTWFENTYPGCACDVQSHLYSFSFEQNPDWSRSFAGREEIWQYFSFVAKKYGLIEHIRFRTEVVAMHWDEGQKLWRLKLNITGDNGVVREVDTTANVVISAMGPLNRPHYPEIPGLHDFKGPLLHTARWDHGISWKGKKVGMIGNAASGVQVSTELVKKVDQLVVFQRTPNWIIPRPMYKHPEFVKTLFRHVPGLQSLWRFMLYLKHDLRHMAFRSDTLAHKVATKYFGDQMRARIRDVSLQSKLIPTYALGCKRIIVHDEYLQAMQQPVAILVTDGISHIDEEGVVTKTGEKHVVDALVLATGFLVQDYLGHVEIVGKKGMTLKEKWKEASEAYLGITVSGFPNFYLLLGPHTALGHSSVITMIECQVNYIIQILRAQLHNSTPTIEVRPSAEKAFTNQVYKDLENTSWNLGGCNSWYKNAKGRVTALWPHTVFWYWISTWKVKWADYDPVIKPARRPILPGLIVSLILMIALQRYGWASFVLKWFRGSRVSTG